MGAYLSYQKKEKFFVILCGDVLLEVLQFGNRRQLVKLERVGRRLHWIVDDCFGCRPFLRLRLNLMPRSYSLLLMHLEQQRLFLFFILVGKWKHIFLEVHGTKYL